MHRCLALLSLVLCACGNGTSAAPDAAGADARLADAASADASRPDAFDQCPGLATFQVGVVDWVEGGNLAGVTVSDGVNQANSAPNGRVVLCVPRTGALTIRFTHADYVERTHSTTGELVTELSAAEGVARFRLLKPADADALYSGVGAVRDLTKATVIAVIRDRTTGADAADITASLAAANDGAYTPGATPTALVAGQISASDGRVLFLNSEIGSSTLSASGCSSPAAIAIEAGGISSATVACSP